MTAVAILPRFACADGGTTGAAVTTFLFDQQSCLLKPGATMPFNRSSIDPSRQANSHVHTVVVDQAASTAETVRVLAADLGGDVVYSLSVRQSDGAITLLHVSHMKPGSGPRHIAIHPTLRVAYVVHEMSNELSVHAVDGSSGALTQMQTLSTVGSSPVPTCTGLQQEQTMCSKAAEIVITAKGDSIFVSNRGFGSPDTNSIAGYKVLSDGTVGFAQLAQSLTRYPRGMALAADSSRLLVAGQGSGNLVAFALGASAGTVRLPGVQLATGLATPTTVVSF